MTTGLNSGCGSAAAPRAGSEAAIRQDRRPSRAPVLLALLTISVGVVGAWHYSSIGLSLSHYDARAHLVVARRILDNLVPGWQQVGAVWLPLPHLLNMVPVQVDAWYRSGASAIAISVLSMALGAWALSRTLIDTTGSVVAGAAGVLLLIGNPNLLYLQSTPMTEPLLVGITLLAMSLAVAWLDGRAVTPAKASLALAAACMTRYEAWPITVAIIAICAAVLLRRGAGLAVAARACGRLSVYPVMAILLFAANSRWTTGEWLVSGGFFVAENEALGRPLLAFTQVRDGVFQLSGNGLVWPAYVSVAAILGTFAVSRSRASLAVLLAAVAAGALPWYAYYQGHPLRIRYSLPVVAACAIVVGAGIALVPRRLRFVVAATLVVAVFAQSPPWNQHAPMIIEAQRDAKNRIGRQTVTDYLRAHHDGTPIMMSMGSLAHYMHDLSREGFAIRDFLHEGNGELWSYAVEYGPRGFADWVVIEERAEGGDALFQHAQRKRDYLADFERVAEGGGVGLYRRKGSAGF